MARTRDVIVPPRGYRSREAGLFVAQLDEQSGRLKSDLRGASARELAWQSAPGMNTMGMLLAHIAIVEVFWVQIGPLRRARTSTETVLGMNSDDDGIPLEKGGAPPHGLAGKTRADYVRLLDKARAYTKRALRDLRDADMERMVERTRRDGTRETLNMRWIVYHVLEHLAGHYGQILLLRHAYRVTRDAKG
jgi:uncharacterized damage-inducible protein DinB